MQTKQQSNKNKTEISQLKRILNKFRYGLVLQAIRNQLAKIGIEFTPYYWIQTDISETKIPEIDGIISEYSVGVLSKDELILIAENTNGYSKNEFLSRLEDGQLCLGLWHHNIIVVFMWINLKQCNFAPINTPLANNEAYLKEIYTIESYRGKGLAPLLRYKSYEILKEMGCEKLYSVTEYFNTSALRYMRKTNAKIIKLVLFVRLFKKIKWSYTIKTY